MLLSPDYLTVIIVNLGVLLLASWVLGFVIFNRQQQDKNTLETELAEAKKKLKQKPPKQQQAPTPAAKPADPNYPLAPIVVNQEDADSTYLLKAMDKLNNELLEKEQKLAALTELQEQQAAMVDNLSEDSDQESIDELKSKQQETQAIVYQLRSDLQVSQHTIKELENKLREGQDKDGRIAILEETERRLRTRLDTIKGSNQQAGTLAEGLRKANDKNSRLAKDNQKLKNNLRQLANASQEQLTTIKNLTNEVDRMSKLENLQKSKIDDLQTKLQRQIQSDGNSDETRVLEGELDELKEALERTLKEKDFIESHLLEMDKALQNAKETEAALERARKEIETLEMYFPEFTADDAQTPTREDTHEPLPQLTITAEDDPDLFNVVSDNRLFGILNEFWMTLDAPPLQVIAQESIARPKQLNLWAKTAIDKDIYWVAIGTSQAMIELLAKAMFKNTDHALNDNDYKDALGELGNVLAGTLTNELDPTFIVGIPEHLDENKMLQQLDKVAIAAELLVTANEYPLYISLVKPIEST